MGEFVTTTGLAELERTLVGLPRQVESRLRAVAFVTANRLAGSARALARAHGWVTLPGEIAVREVAGDKLFIVEVKPANPRPMNLPLWLEHGTRKMSPRPFMAPPTAEASAGYPADIEQSLQALFDEQVNA